MLVAVLFFVWSVAQLSKIPSAKRGNSIGAIGMVIGITFAALQTFYSLTASASGFQVAIPVFVAVLAAGGLLGVIWAKKVDMQGMPGLIGLLNAFGGLAAVFEGVATVVDPAFAAMGDRVITRIFIFLGVGVGSITWWGSVIAFLKLKEGPLCCCCKYKFPQDPKVICCRNFWDLLCFVSMIGLTVVFCLIEIPGWTASFGTTDMAFGVYLTIALLVVTLFWGIIFVMAIGGADMPVAISILNSLSGWSGCLTGFMMKNNLLICAGTLVGASGFILTQAMCEAMARPMISVLMGGFGGSSGGASSSGSDAEARYKAIEATPYHTMKASQFAQALVQAESIIVVPGYGLASARAQMPLAQMARMLTRAGKKVRFAIHPVAGRLPGHMNVLLAEAAIPYDLVCSLEDLEDEWAATDLGIVIGANDIVNPLSIEEPGCPLGGMPVIKVWDAKQTVVLKRAIKGRGYANVPNPLFFRQNNSMLLGDAAKSLEQTIGELGAILPSSDNDDDDAPDM